MKPNPRSIEMMNRLEFVNLAFKEGYLSFLPVVDEGIDLILYREKGSGLRSDLRLVQMKSRWSINKKYSDRDIWMAFREGDQWYLVRHDDLEKLCDKLGIVKSSKSWTETGAYSRGKMGKALRDEMAAFVFPEPAAAKIKLGTIGRATK